MKKEILVTILVMAGIWCKAQSGTLPADTSLISRPSRIFTLDTTSLSLAGRFITTYTDSNGVVHTNYVPFSINGSKLYQSFPFTKQSAIQLIKSQQ